MISLSNSRLLPLRRLAALALPLVLAACASPALKQTSADIDALQRQIDAPSPLSASEGPLGPVELVASADRRGHDVMKARLKRAEAELALDETRSRRFPRISVEARDFVTYDRRNGVTDNANVVLGVNWDIAYALLGLDSRNIAIAEELIPVQYQLSYRNALGALLAAYASLSEMDFKRRHTLLEADALSCQAKSMRAEQKLGTVSVAEVDAMNARIAAVRSEADAIAMAMEAEESKVMALAGLKAGAQPVAASRSVLPALAGLPKSVAENGESCFSASGSQALENLLVEAAGAQLDLARKSRFTKLTAALPTFMSEDGGLSLQFLVGYVLPLIDQGDSLRLTDRARIRLLETILAARENHREFLNRYNETVLNTAGARRALASADAAIATARTSLSAAPDAEQCAAETALSKARLERAEALFAIEMARARQTLMCAPLPEAQNPA